MLESILHAHTALTSLEGVADRESVVVLVDLLGKTDLTVVVEALRLFNDASLQLSASKQPTGFLVPLVLAISSQH